MSVNALTFNGCQWYSSHMLLKGEVIVKTEGSRIITNEGVADKSLLAYCRVSAVDQNENRQLEAFKKYDLHKIYVEKAFAKDTDRPMPRQLLEYAREPDTIHIYGFHGSVALRSERTLI